LLKKIFILIIFQFRLLSAQDFDPTNPDYNLLKQLVIEKINQKRVRKTQNTLIINEALQITADNYVQKLKARRFEKNSENRIWINKRIKKNCKTNGYKNAYLNFHITSISCVKNVSKKFYYDKEDSETTTHLFIGKKPTRKEKKDENFKSIPVKLYTYSEIADVIAKQFINDEGTFKILNNGYDKYGFSMSVEYKTLYRNKLPKLKMIIIMGGNRITW